MFSNKFVIFFSLAVLVGSIDCGVLPGVAPVVHAVPAVAPAPVAYHHAVPYNIPPYGDRVDIFNRVLSVPAVPALHAVPAPAVAPAIPALHAVPVPAVAPAVAPALPAVAPSIHAVAPAVAPALGHIPAPLTLPHALPAPIPAAVPAPFGAAYAYGHPALAAPVWRR